MALQHALNIALAQMASSNKNMIMIVTKNLNSVPSVPSKIEHCKHYVTKVLMSK